MSNEYLEVGVKFQSSSDVVYTYKCPTDWHVAVGDCAVINVGESPEDPRWKVVKVMSVSEVIKTDNKSLKWIAAVFDTWRYQQLSE